MTTGQVEHVRTRPIAARHNEVAQASPAEVDERILQHASQALQELEEVVREQTDPERARRALERASDLIGWDGVEHAVDQLHLALVTSDRPARRTDVAKAIAKVLGAFPNASKADLRMFSVIAADAIAAAEPSVMGLDVMVRSLTRQSKFVPAVSELLEALQSAHHKIERGWLAVQSLERRWALALAHVEKLTSERQKWNAQRVKDCKAAILDGERVESRFARETVDAARLEIEEELFSSVPH